MAASMSIFSNNYILKWIQLLFFNRKVCEYWIFATFDYENPLKSLKTSLVEITGTNNGLFEVKLSAPGIGSPKTKFIIILLV